jgi:hypothetical protein
MWLWLLPQKSQQLAIYPEISDVEEAIPFAISIDSSYSDATVALYKHDEQEVEVSLLPNPFRTTLQIEINLKETAQMGYRIYDLAGNLVWNRDLFVIYAGVHTDILAVDRWPKGVYFLQLMVEQDGEVDGFYKFRLMHL